MTEVGVSLVIGVTGHRSLGLGESAVALETLTSHVELIFTHLEQMCPHTPIEVISALAEGADRLVARCALQRGYKLAVVLPFPEKEYEKDFRKTKPEFDELLAQATRIVRIPLITRQKLQTFADFRTVRNSQYAASGAYIALHAHILIALWDGVFTRKIGGSSEVVRYRLEGIPRIYKPSVGDLDHSEIGVVYHVPTTLIPINHREAAEWLSEAEQDLHDSILQDKATANRPWEILFPKAWAPQMTGDGKDERRFINALKSARCRHAEFLLAIDNFNRDASMVAPRSCSLLPPQAQDDQPLAPSYETMQAFFSAADALANRHRRTAIQQSLALTFGLVVSVSLFGLFGLLLPNALVLSGFLSASLITVWVWRYMRKTASHLKAQEYRTLAEGLRVQFFWKYFLLRDCAADHLARHGTYHYGWIRQIIRTLGELVTDEIDARSFVTKRDDRIYSLATKEKCARLPIVAEHWIHDRIRYAERSLRRRSVDDAYHTALPVICFSATLASVVSILILKITITGSCRGLADFISFADVKLFYNQTFPALIWLGLILTAFGAGFAWLTTRKAQTNDEIRVRRELDVFLRAQARLEKLRITSQQTLDLRKIDRCLAELGRIVLAELSRCTDALDDREP